MMHLVSLELRKLCQRWLFWIMLGALLASEVIVIIGGYYLTTNGTITVLDEHGHVLPAAIVQPYFILPGALPVIAGVIQQVGSWLLVILAAILIGMEEGYGTLRIILSRGVNHTTYLAAKLITILVMILMFVGLAMASGIGAAFIVATFSLTPIEPLPIEGNLWMTGLELILRVIITFIVPIMIAFSAALLSRSQTAGIAIGLGYFVITAMLSGFLKGIGEVGQRIWVLLPGAHIETLMAYNQLSRDIVIPSYLPSQPIAVLVLLGYALLLAGISWMTLQRRDIYGGTAQ